jgi:hypothetical protein
MRFLAIFAVLLVSSYAEGQSTPPGERLVDFESRDVGHTESLLKFAVQQHLSIAIEYVDSESMNRRIEVSLRNQTIAHALDSILSNGQGYKWALTNGMIEIKNSHASSVPKAN